MARLVEVPPDTVLRALIDHGRDRGYWPSSVELYRRRKRRLGGRDSVARMLRALAAAGLIRREGTGGEVRWVPTPDAYTRLGRAPVILADPPSRSARRRHIPQTQAAKRRRDARIAAAQVLDHAGISRHTPQHAMTTDDDSEPLRLD